MRNQGIMLYSVVGCRRALNGATIWCSQSVTSLNIVNCSIFVKIDTAVLWIRDIRILGSVPLSNGSGCGSGRPKKIRILRIRMRILNTGKKSWGSHKTVKSRFFLLFLLDDRRIREAQKHRYGSYGSGSTTLLDRRKSKFRDTWSASHWRIISARTSSTWSSAGSRSLNRSPRLSFRSSSDSSPSRMLPARAWRKNDGVFCDDPPPLKLP